MHAFSLFFRLRGGVPAEHEGHDHKERRGAQADGVDHHDVRKGADAVWSISIQTIAMIFKVLPGILPALFTGFAVVAAI